MVTEEFVGGMENAIGRAVPSHLRLRERARQNTAANLIWRAGVLLLGLVLITAGVAMLVLPGPGWASIFLGMAILASEYTWARRLLAPLRERARAARLRAQALDASQRRRIFVAGGVVVACAVGFGWWWWQRYGLPLP